MGSNLDGSDFVDSEFQPAQKTSYVSATTLVSASAAGRPPSVQDLDTKVTDNQQQLAELKTAQEQLERERAALEEARRRRLEFQRGREEMLNHLTRGVGILEEAEFSARRDAEQMVKSLIDMREALEKVSEIKEESWTRSNWEIELTRALTILENARMEWNSSRLKWPKLDGTAKKPEANKAEESLSASFLRDKNFLDLCKIGLALNWPVAVVGLAGALAIVLMLLRR